MESNFKNLFKFNIQSKIKNAMRSLCADIAKMKIPVKAAIRPYKRG